MNPERLKKLQAQVAQVRIGGKGENRFELWENIKFVFTEEKFLKYFFLYYLGTPRRKKKIVHQTAATDDKKLQSTLKKLAVNPIQGIEEVNIFKNDQTVIVFNNPRTQASLASNTFAITGHSETKNVGRLKFPRNLQLWLCFNFLLS